MQRLYDEWDQFTAKATNAEATSIDAHLHSLCTRTSTGPVATSAIPVSMRLLASVADITQANRARMQRILAEHLAPDGQHDHGSALDLAQLEPRLTCAVNVAGHPAHRGVEEGTAAVLVGLYRLLCGKDTGPRLPTLLLSIGPDRARALLG